MAGVFCVRPADPTASFSVCVVLDHDDDDASTTPARSAELEPLQSLPPNPSSTCDETAPQRGSNSESKLPTQRLADAHLDRALVAVTVV